MLVSPSSSRTIRPRAPGRLPSRQPAAPNDVQTLRTVTSTPPPPYDSRTPSFKQLKTTDEDSEQSATTLLGSSVLATAQMLGYELPSTAALDEHVLQQKSRDELFELLRNAEQVICAHETELNLAALAGEALLRENTDLRSRQDTLVARSMPAFDSLRAFAMSKDADASLEQHLVLSAPPADGTERDDLSLPTPLPRKKPQSSHSRGHTRRLSASPEQIAALNSQNEELQSRLECIVAEAGETDRESKLKLRNFQREIEGLRAELEDTQRRNAELETAAAQHARTRTWVEPRRRTSHSQLDAFEDDGSPNASMSSDIRDFAPPRFHRRASTTASIRSLHSSGSTDVSLLLKSPSLVEDVSTTDLAISEQEEDDEDLFGPTLRRSRLTSCTPAEATLLTQILSKVKELEDAKNTFSASQRDMQEKLDAAARDANQMKQLYDGLQVEELECSDDNGDTIRLYSLKAANSFAPSRTSTPRRVASPLSAAPVVSNLNLPDSPFLTVAEPHLMGLGNLKSRKLRQPLTDRMFAPSPGTERPDPFGSHEDNEGTLRASVYRRTPRRALRSVRAASESSLQQEDDDNSTDNLDDDGPAMSSDSNATGRSVRKKSLVEELGNDSWPGSIPAGQAISPSTDGDSLSNLAAELSVDVEDDGRYVVESDGEESNAPTSFPAKQWFDKLAGPQRRKRLASARRRRMSAASRGNTVSKAANLELELAKMNDGEATETENEQPVTAPTGLQGRTVALLMEIWLFLQFVIVLGVFVFVMARKGPRAVLKEPVAPKRR
ncbi:hypothetical protein BKA62DRAFT_391704 [Auriculariales sp. MPI-PUGE-AT-0066]|nr:hypothetical protein BKA62DRAFT_391704 [Auriculariales sp. MPI-PUGE-AT-0066]